MAFQIGFLLFPGIQQLDLVGPYEVCAMMPDTKVHLIWKTREPQAASNGLALMPDITFDECPPLDVLCVAGGVGVNNLLEDEATLDFIKQHAASARFITSVCTGALVLGAAGLLHGRRATTHWAFHHLLGALGAIPVKQRVVHDGNLMTGGGVTAGIDFGLTLAAELIGQDEAQAIQLQLEYAPAPPFNAGTPDTAPPAIVELVQKRSVHLLAKREEIVARAAAKL